MSVLDCGVTVYGNRLHHSSLYSKKFSLTFFTADSLTLWKSTGVTNNTNYGSFFRLFYVFRFAHKLWHYWLGMHSTSNLNQKELNGFLPSLIVLLILVLVPTMACPNVFTEKGILYICVTYLCSQFTII